MVVVVLFLLLFFYEFYPPAGVPKRMRAQQWQNSSLLQLRLCATVFVYIFILFP